jgi:hypothetical protein
MPHLARSAIVALEIAVAAAALASCSSPDQPFTGASTNKVPFGSENTASMCHRSGPSGEIVDVALSDISKRRDHGDYLTHLYVSNDPEQPTNATHFHLIGDALAAARSGRLARGETNRAACRITIDVAPGVFFVTGDSASTGPLWDHIPFVVDVPDLTFHGAFVMALDGNGRATGRGVGSKVTTLASIGPLGFDDSTFATRPVFIANGHPHGSAGNGLTVEGFIFQAGNAEGDASGQAVFSLRAHDLRVVGNRMEGGFLGALDLRASDAVIARNYLTSAACAFCLAGPGNYTVTANRIVGGGEDGIFVNGVIVLDPVREVEPYEAPEHASLFVDIGNNDVRNYQNRSVAAGIRLGSFGPNGSGVRTAIHAHIHDNLLVNNLFGMIFEAGFPQEGTPLKGDMDIVLHNDVFRQICEANVFTSFARHIVGLGLADGPYLRKSIQRLDLGNDLRPADLWYANPSGFGNKLFVNGRLMPHGNRTFSSDTGCPNQGT